MKRVIIVLLATAIALPVSAQENAAVPLLRVYVDAPYFYDILADVSDSGDPRAHAMTLIVEGKEVGASRLVYDCETGDYSETVVTAWSGRSALFMQPALMAYHDLYC